MEFGRLARSRHVEPGDGEHSAGASDEFDRADRLGRSRQLHVLWQYFFWSQLWIGYARRYLLQLFRIDDDRSGYRV